MKDKFKAFFAILGITKVESNADGIFMKEEDMEKVMAAHTENTQLKTDLQTAKDAHTADNTAKDAVIASLTEEKATLTTANSTLTAENTRLTSELAAAQAGEIKVEKKADPDIVATSKKKMSANEIAAEKNAAALRGETFLGADAEEDEETETPEKKKKQ